MCTPMMGNLLPAGRVWAGDTGCFAQPERHDDAGYLAWLIERNAADRCLFATAPDVVGDAKATLARSKAMLRVIRGLGYRAALVAQDGLEHLAVPWETFDCLFIGGTTRWKLSEAAAGLVREAKGRGKWVHVGRVNSERRVMRAKEMGADSVDGTYIAFGPDRNAPRVRQWMARAVMQQVLW